MNLKLEFTVVVIEFFQLDCSGDKIVKCSIKNLKQTIFIIFKILGCFYLFSSYFLPKHIMYSSCELSRQASGL